MKRLPPFTMLSIVPAIATCITLIQPATSLQLNVEGLTADGAKLPVNHAFPVIRSSWVYEGGDPSVVRIVLLRNDSYQFVLDTNVDLSLGETELMLSLSPIDGRFSLQAVGIDNSTVFASTPQFDLADVIYPTPTSFVPTVGSTVATVSPTSYEDTAPKLVSPAAIVGVVLSVAVVFLICLILILRRRRRSRYPTVDPLVCQDNIIPAPARRGPAFRKGRPQVVIRDPEGQIRSEKVRIRDQHNQVQFDLEANMLRREQNRRASRPISPISPTEVDLRTQLQILQDRILILEAQQERSASVTPPPDYVVSDNGEPRR
ncbi:hypothetical protein BDN72DRAFT_883664 [Pluteus cervinus]|uniref:Uncharacterized protein n=1 Tax=Pluteus cervinus TaxID=181527 RepID=A0ACD3A655_9AGAR|nr:hypothetical protein BDN72DRAFT_883664 [Pluteus cervinus]